MFITKKQLEEIRRGLATMGVRDTDLPDATTLSGSELVAIVQDGENRIVPIGDLFGKYLEGMLPYAVRGKSAYEIWLEQEGNAGKTVQQFLEYLQAAVDIDNDFSGGAYKVASADEAKYLKELVDGLNSNALTVQDIVNSLESNDPTKPLSAAMGKYLLQLIRNSGGGSGSTTVYDGLDSTKKDWALSANMGRELANRISQILELNGVAQTIYKWSGEFEDLRIPPADNKYTLANANTVYQLWMLLKDIEGRVAVLESGESVTPSGDTKTYRLVIEAEGDATEMNASATLTLKALYNIYENNKLVSSTDVTSSDKCTWSSSNAVASVVRGLVTSNNQQSSSKAVAITATYGNKEASYAIKVRGAGDDAVVDPTLSVSENYLVADSNGLFLGSGGTYSEDNVVVTVNTGNTTSDWNFQITYGRQGTGNGFISATKDPVDNTKLIISVAYGPNGRKNITNHMLDGIIKVYLNDDATVYKNITVYQRSAEEEKEFAIVNYSGGTSSKVPAMGGTITLYVRSDNGLWEITDDDGLTITPTSGGNSSEEPIKVVVPASESVEEYTITAKQIGTNDEATYSILLDASVTNSIVLVDEKGMGQTSVSAKGGVKALKVYASGPWAVTTNQSWITPYNKTNYPWSGNTGTGPNGATIYFQINGSVASRSSYIKAALTGEGMTGYTSTLTVYQSGQSGQSSDTYSGTFEAFFTVYGEYAPVGTSIVPIEGTSDYGVALVFHALYNTQNVAWCIPETAINEYSDWLHINTYSPETINGTSYYVHYAHAVDGNLWYYIAADVDALPENMDYRIAEIPIDIYTMDSHEYITTVSASLVQERSEVSSNSAVITAEIVGGTDEFSYDTRSVTINATCTSTFVNTKWTAYIGDQTTDIIPTINGSNSDTGDVPDNNIELALQFAADNTSDVAKTTQVVIKCQNKFSERTLKTVVVSFARLPEDTGGGEGGDDEPIVPNDPIIVQAPNSNIVGISCTTSGASIFYSSTSAQGPYVPYNQQITISEDTDFWAYSMLGDVRSENISYYEATYYDGGQGGGDDPVETEYTIAAQNITIDPDGGQGSTNVTVTPSADWTYETSFNWFEVDTTGSSITLTANKNTEGNRTGTILLYVVGHKDQYNTTITVSQNKSTTPEPGPDPGPDPVVTPAAPVFSQSGNVVTITCSTSGADIYYAEGSSQTYTLYDNPIRISQNTSFSAYSILNNVRHGSSDVTYTATYIQPQPGDGCTANPQTLDFHPDGGSLTTTVTASGNWSITVPNGATWITNVSPSSGSATNNTTVTITVDENTGDSRNAILIMACGAATTNIAVTQRPAPSDSISGLTGSLSANLTEVSGSTDTYGGNTYQQYTLDSISVSLDTSGATWEIIDEDGYTTDRTSVYVQVDAVGADGQVYITDSSSSLSTLDPGQSGSRSYLPGANEGLYSVSKGKTPSSITTTLSSAVNSPIPTLYVWIRTDQSGEVSVSGTAYGNSSGTGDSVSL